MNVKFPKFYKNGEILKNTIVTADIPIPYTATSYDCNENLSQYKETLLCDGDDAIAVMTMEDRVGNTVELDLRIRGDVRIGFRKSENEDYVFYKHYSQFPDELTKIIKNGEVFESNRVFVDECNWMSIVYHVYNKEGIEVQSDMIPFEDDISVMTTAEVKAVLEEIGTWALDLNCKEKVAVTLNELLLYVRRKWAVTSKGDDILIKDYPAVGFNTCLTKDMELDEFTVSLWKRRPLGNSDELLAKSGKCYFCWLYNTIIDIGTGKFGIDDTDNFVNTKGECVSVAEVINNIDLAKVFKCDTSNVGTTKGFLGKEVSDLPFVLDEMSYEVGDPMPHVSWSIEIWSDDKYYDAFFKRAGFDLERKIGKKINTLTELREEPNHEDAYINVYVNVYEDSSVGLDVVLVDEGYFFSSDFTYYEETVTLTDDEQTAILEIIKADLKNKGENLEDHLKEAAECFADSETIIRTYLHKATISEVVEFTGYSADQLYAASLFSTVDEVISQMPEDELADYAAKYLQKLKKM